MTLIFLDHSFHQKTRSTYFLRSAFTAAGWTIFDLWDDEWNGGPGVSPSEISRHCPDLLISFQVLKTAQFYRETGCRRVLLVPMYDSSRGMKPWDWWEYRKFSFLHFSNTLMARTTRLGIRGACLQYFPNPAQWNPVPWASRSGDVFFWQRVANVPISSVVPVVRSILGAGRHRFHWHHAVDPGESTEALEAPDFEVKETHWLPSQEELQSLLLHQKLFVAPRLAEGIGMSFLEAMAMGCVVVANDDATMNEYIVHGVNGILLDWQKPPKSVSISSELEQIGAEARKSVEVGYADFSRKMAALVADWEHLFPRRQPWTLLGVAVGLVYLLRHWVVRPTKRLLGRG